MKKDELFLSGMIAAIICLIISLFAIITSDGINITIEMPKAENAVANTIVTDQPTVQNTTETTTQTPTSSVSNNQTTNVSTTENTSSEQKLPSTPEEILNKYTMLMEKAKTSCPAFTKVEYQHIPNEKINFDGGAFGKILPLLSNFMVSEEDARANPEKHVKGDGMYWFPVYKTEKGCLLTDASKIKSATCTPTSDGNVKISIILNDEVDSAPAAEGATSCSSAVGSMFAPIERASVDDTMENDFAVKLVVRDINYTLTYYDCTADMIYNPSNDQIVSLDHYMHTLITINSGKVVGMNAAGTAVLDNYMYITDFEY